MRKKWSSWNPGGKIIFFSACAGVISLFLPWLIDPLSSRTLYQLPIGSVPMLFVLITVPFGYPAFALWTGRPVRKGWGMVCAGFGFFLAGWIINGITAPIPGSVTGGPSISFYSAGNGAALYIASTIGVAAGILFYRLRPAN